MPTALNKTRDPDVRYHDPYVVQFAHAGLGCAARWTHWPDTRTEEVLARRQRLCSIDLLSVIERYTMAVQLRLDVDQISAAIRLLSQTEKRELKQRLPLIIDIDQDALEDLGWLRLAESSFAFWDDAEEDIYNDLIPSANVSLES